ncbi:MAG: polysaccharide deacetylase family protein [Bryobacteraceae bacterium]
MLLSFLVDLIPPKTVVLTFDDAVKSHRTTVGPLLAELGFHATFFISHRWMDDKANFMTWEDIAELHRMGFEIGNHSWTHGNFSTPYAAARMAGELALIENALARVKVPKPVSFAWSGNAFGPECVRVLRDLGYRFARRGGMPEVEYGRATVGPLFDPARRHPLLIPTTGDSYPNWTFEHFQTVVSQATEGRAVVLQYHGVPDVAHPWVHSDPELFRRSMRYLKDQGYRVVALRDLAPYIDEQNPPRDPVLEMRHPIMANPKLAPEVAATRAKLDYWRGVMAAHGYSREEMSAVAGQPVEPAEPARAAILPYPGGRHPRIGFLDGAIDPMRGSKASVFLPWDPSSYLVVDVPEAIISAKGGILFLAHTHIPTVWDGQHKAIDNVDWTVDGAALRNEWTLPNGVVIGARVAPAEAGVDMELWLRNGTNAVIPELRAQVCVMFKRAAGFTAQTNDNKQLGKTMAKATGAGHTITVEWEPCHRVWANPPCPCMHSDPLLGDCAPGQTVRATGRLRWI